MLMTAAEFWGSMAGALLIGIGLGGAIEWMRTRGSR